MTDQTAKIELFKDKVFGALYYAELAYDSAFHRDLEEAEMYLLKARRFHAEAWDMTDDESVFVEGTELMDKYEDAWNAVDRAVVAIRRVRAGFEVEPEYEFEYPTYF